MLRKISTISVALIMMASVAQGADLSPVPENAKPGECYARVLVPPKYEKRTEKVLVKEPSEKIKVIPPKIEWVEEKIEIRPEIKEIVPVPPKYKKVTETFTIREAERKWTTSLKKNAPPVSPEILNAAKAAGVDIDGTQPNTCYREYYTPAKYKTVAEEIVVKEESEKIEVIPPKFEWVEKKVMVRPPIKKLVPVPAKYEIVEEKILVEPEKTVWKKGTDPAQKIAGATGDIMCLVKIPAKYKIIKKKVLKSPATTKVVEIPAEYKTIKIKKLVQPAQIKKVKIPAIRKQLQKTVLEAPPSFMWKRVGESPASGFSFTGHQICLVEIPAKTVKIAKMVVEQPATTKEVVIPAEFKTIKVAKVVEPAKVIKIPVPAQYITVTKIVKVSEPTIKWQRILCKTNMSPDLIAALQEALNKKGYNAGKVDGKLGRQTLAALERFQKDKGLATGGITYETLKALGINL